MSGSRRWFSRTTVALLIGAAAFAVTLGAGLLVFYGGVGAGGGPDEGEMPHASFAFEQTEVTVGEENRTFLAVVMAHESGMDLSQESVVVTVNGAPAWDLRGTENGTEVARPWNGTGQPLSRTDARIVLYGTGPEAGVLEGSGVPDGARELQPGDVVEVTWHGDGELMTVLQRYTVDDREEEEAADAGRPATPTTYFRRL